MANGYRFRSFRSRVVDRCLLCRKGRFGFRSRVLRPPNVAAVPNRWRNSPRSILGQVLAIASLVGCLAVLLITSGCGSPASASYEVSGTVTYDGKPIPRGNIVFTPDSKAGNTGPGTVAEIKDGKFETPDGKGVVGGKYILLVTGYDGVPVEGGEGMNANGSLLCRPHELRKDLSTADSTVDINIPQELRG